MTTTTVTKRSDSSLYLRVHFLIYPCSLDRQLALIVHGFLFDSLSLCLKS